MADTFTIDRTPVGDWDLTTGHVRVGDLDVGFVELSRKGTSTRRALLAAGEDGLALARPLSEMALPPRLAPLDDHAIAEVMRKTITVHPAPIAPMAGRAVMEQSLLPEDDRPIDKTILGIAIAHPPSRSEKAAMRARLSAAFDPAMARIGRVRTSLFGTWPAPVTGGEEPTVLSLPSWRLDHAVALIEARPWLRFLARTHADFFDAETPGEFQSRALAAIGVTGAAARRFDGLGGMIGDETLHLLRSVPHDWVPRRGDREEWEAMRVVAESTMSRTMLTRGFARTILAHCRGKWRDFLDACCKPASLDPDCLLAAWRPAIEREATFTLDAAPAETWDPERQSLAAAVADITDMRTGFSGVLRKHVPHDPWRGGGPPRWKDPSGAYADVAVYGERGLPALLQASRRWHRDPAMAPAKDAPGIEWPALLPAWTDEPTGIEVIPLANSRALLHEGMRGKDPQGNMGLSHCVGGGRFPADCARGRIRIVSLRREGVRLSTAEIVLGTIERDVGVAQHRALHNRVPGLPERQALDRYLALPEVRSARGEAVAMPMGRGRPTRASFAAALNAWRPYLAGPWREMDGDEIRRRMRSPSAAPEPAKPRRARRESTARAPGP